MTDFVIAFGSTPVYFSHAIFLFLMDFIFPSNSFSRNPELSLFTIILVFLLNRSFIVLARHSVSKVIAYRTLNKIDQPPIAKIIEQSTSKYGCKGPFLLFLVSVSSYIVLQKFHHIFCRWFTLKLSFRKPEKWSTDTN